MDYTIMPGHENERVEQWMRLNQAAAGGSLPAARAASGFWKINPDACLTSPPGFPDDDDDSPDGGGPPRQYASTLVSIEIEARIFVCANCRGIHHTQACPETRAALYWRDPTPCVYDTITMVRLWAVDRAGLVTKLRRLTRPQLLSQAVSFAAWLEACTQSGLPAASVLHIWEQMIQNNDDGPAAPAMMRAA